jgi:hypothetical protein
MALNPQTGQRMGREAILTELRALSKVRVKSVEIEGHIARLRSESDRGVMILAGSLVEDALLTVLERTVYCPNRELRETIYGHEGPLGTFSRRIDFTLALRLIPKETAQRMHTIRFIRNTAAHAHVDFDFNTPQVKWALGTMLTNEQADDFETWPRKNVRNFYLHICGIYADQIIGDLDDPDAIMAFFRTIRASDLDELPTLQNK